MPLLSKLKIDNLKLDGAGGSNIKSIQKNTALLTSTSLDVTVTAIDTSKTILVFSYKVQNGSPDRSLITGQIINSTTIRFQRYTGAPDATIEWQLIEFNNVKSLQRGATTMSSGSTSTTQSITSVDTTKSMVVASWRAGEAFTTEDYRKHNSYRLSSATQLSFECMLSGYSKIFEWQVIEFS